MTSDEKLAATAISYGIDIGASGCPFSHLMVHAKMAHIQKERLEPAQVYRWLMCSGRFEQDQLTRYLRLIS